MQQTRCRVFVAVFLTVVVLGAVGAGDSMASGSNYSRVVALAHSPTGRKAQAVLASTVSTSAAHALASELLRDSPASFSPLQREVLDAAVRLTSPSASSLLSAMSSGQRLSRSHEKTFVHLMHALAANRAIRLVVSEGHRVQHDHAAVAKMLSGPAAAIPARSQRALSTGNRNLDTLIRTLERVQTSKSVASYVMQLRRLLPPLSAARLIQHLPPLIVGSMVPPSQLLTSALSSSRRARASTLVPPSVGPVLDVIWDHVSDRLIDFGMRGLKEAFADTTDRFKTAYRSAFIRRYGIAAFYRVGVLGEVYFAATAFAHGLKWGIEGADALITAATTWAPMTLEVVKAGEAPHPDKGTVAIVGVGQRQKFWVYGINAHDDRNRDADATLKIGPPPAKCDPDCWSAKPGTYLVTAKDGSATGTASLRVDPTAGGGGGGGTTGPKPGGEEPGGEHGGHPCGDSGTYTPGELYPKAICMTINIPPTPVITGVLSRSGFAGTVEMNNRACGVGYCSYQGFEPKGEGYGIRVVESMGPEPTVWENCAISTSASDVPINSGSARGGIVLEPVNGALRADGPKFKLSFYGAGDPLCSVNLEVENLESFQVGLGDASSSGSWPPIFGPYPGDPGTYSLTYLW